MKYLPILAMFIFMACNSEHQHSEESGHESDAHEHDAPTTDNKYTLTAFTASTSYPDAKMAGMKYDNGRFDFDVQGTAYKLGMQTPDARAKGCANSAKGQHIHLIVDNLPYAAKYEAAFDYDVADGKHDILAFLSRSYHESIKTADAYMTMDVEVKDGSIVNSSVVESPRLYYSRPKGVYDGDDTKRVMLDFYLANTAISDGGNYVEADINGEIHDLTSWQPYYIDGLPGGENVIKLTLKDKDGNRINTDLNPVTRKFTLNPY